MNFKGKLLVAETATYGDNYFSRSVIVITEDTDQEVIGFVLNIPEENILLQDIFPDINTPFRLFSGGPVEQDNIYFLHNIDALKQPNLKITDTLYWGKDLKKTLALLNKNEINQADIRFFLGYSGWTKKQLLEEIDKKYWAVITINSEENLLKHNPDNLWKKLMLTLGGTHSLWANAPKDPFMN